MKVIGIAGSPRRAGYSSLLLDSSLAGARSEGAQAEKIFLDDLSIRPCQACGGCSSTGRCVIRDDMDAIRQDILTCDALILATPIYFASMTAQMKTFIDRFQDVWVSKYILKKPLRHEGGRCALLCSSGREESEYMENVSRIVTAFAFTMDLRYCGNVLLAGTNDMDRSSGSLGAAESRAFEIGAGIVNGEL